MIARLMPPEIERDGHGEGEQAELGQLEHHRLQRGAAGEGGRLDEREEAGQRQQQGEEAADPGAAVPRRPMSRRSRSATALPPTPCTGSSITALRRAGDRAGRGSPTWRSRRG